MEVPGGAAAMSIEKCILACDAAGYGLAGVERSGECCKYFEISTIKLYSNICRLR